MTIRLTNSRTLESISAEFNEVYPYLKLVFVTKRPTRMLGDFKATETDKHLSIFESLTVGQLVDQFNRYYGLNVQVFRKSGRSWLETKATESWTLAKQNSEGQALSQMPFNGKSPKFISNSGPNFNPNMNNSNSSSSPTSPPPRG